MLRMMKLGVNRYGEFYWSRNLTTKICEVEAEGKVEEKINGVGMGKYGANFF